VNRAQCLDTELDVARRIHDFRRLPEPIGGVDV
jgi:hypothetical protein